MPRKLLARVNGRLIGTILNFVPEKGQIGAYHYGSGTAQPSNKDTKSAGPRVRPSDTTASMPSA